MNVEYEFKVNNITYMNFDMGFEEVSDTMPVVKGKHTVQVFVGAEVTVDISKIWKAFKDLIKNTFNPD